MRNRHSQSRYWRELIGSSLSLTITSASYLVLGITDIWFIGRLGTAEQAGVGLGLTLTLTVGAFVWGVLKVVESFVSQHFGAAGASGWRPDALARCGQSQRETLVVGAALGLLTVAAIPLIWFVAQNFGASAEVSQIAANYAAVRTVGTAVTCLSDVSKGFFRAINRPAIPMVLAVLSVAVNFPLDYWFIFGGLGLAPLGATGAALATVVITVAELIALVLIYELGPFSRRYGHLLGPISWRAIRRQIRVGAPIGVSWLALQGGYTAFWAIVAHLGDRPLGTHSVVARFTEIFVLPASSIGITVTIFVAQALGARDTEHAKSLFRSGIALALVCSAAIAGLIHGFGESIIRGFSQDEEVIALARRLFPWVMAFQAISGLGLVIRGVLQGSGDTKPIMWVSLAEPFLLLVPLTWIFSVEMDGGLTGAWAASVVSVTVVSAALLIRVLAGRWRESSLVDDDGVGRPGLS